MNSTKFFSKRNITIMGVALGLFAIGLALLIIPVLRRPVGASLTPKEDIQVAGSRYVSPCQVLPETSVENIYGKLPDKSYITEAYFDQSISKEMLAKTADGTIDTHCTYEFNDGQNRTLTTTLTYFPDESEARKSWENSVDLGNGTYDKQLADFETALAADQAAGKTTATYDKESQALIDTMKQTLPLAKRQAGSSVQGLDRSIIFNSARSEFIAVHHNMLVTLHYEFGSANPFDENRKISSDELRSVLGPVQKSFDVIFANIANASLSQAPSPTLRDQKQPKVGETSILEPCEILDSKAFEEITKLPNNDPIVERDVINKNPSLDRTHVDGYPIIPDNSCLRRYDSNLAATADKSVRNAYVSLELGYGKSSDQAAQNLSGVVKSMGSDILTKVSSDAERTYYRDTTHGSLRVQSIRFQKHGYVGTLTIAKDDENAESMDVPKKDFIDATNLILKKLP